MRALFLLLVCGGCQLSAAPIRDGRAVAICQTQARYASANQFGFVNSASTSIETQRACLELYDATGILPGFPSGLPNDIRPTKFPPGSR